MILRGRLPHALLITGPRGGGRRTMAMDLAKAANCLRPDPDGAPCQECLSCRKADSGNHPDIFTVVSGKRSRVIDIDSIRALRDRLAFRPFEGRAKVAVVPGAEDMSREGSGALLKTLEEPSEASLIILTSISASMVLETLVSRSVVIKLPPLPRRRLIEAIGAGRGISGPAAELLAGLSAGALGQACGMDPDKASSMWGALGEVFGGGSRGERISSAMDFTERHLQEAYPTRGGAAPEDPSEASERL
jgi:DNA polymerase-3 subunit delta'